MTKIKSRSSTDKSSLDKGVDTLDNVGSVGGGDRTKLPPKSNSASASKEE